VAPCGGSDVIAVFNRKANEDPPPARTLRPELSEEIEVMLMRAMARRPPDRHQTMAELKDEIMGCLARVHQTPAAPGSPRRTGPGATTERLIRTGPRAAWIAGLAAVAALAVAAAIVPWRGDPGSPSGQVGTRASLVAAASAPPTIVPASPPAPPSVPPAAPAPPRPTDEIVVDGFRPLPSKPASPSTTRPRAIAARASLASAPRASSGAGRSAEPASRPATVVPGGGTPGAGAPGANTPTAFALLGRGRSAFAKGNFPEAVRLGRAVIAAGDALGGHLLLGDSFYKMERISEAVAEYDVALKVAPGNPQALRGRELALRRARP